MLIGQLVSINGAQLSKRAGNIIEMDDLREWLGTDALRYSLARYPADSPLTLDPELLRKRTNDNPVFYVQYAHARTHNVARNAAASGVDRSEFDPELLDPRDRVGAARRARRSSRASSRRRRGARAAPRRPLPRGARRASTTAGTTTAGSSRSATSRSSDVHRTRLWLNDATGQVLRNGLDLLGVTRPNGCSDR